MRQAKGLLLDTNLPIHDVAAKVGYDDSLAFSKVFKNQTGMSPRAFRSENKS